jgi:uncharacterized membrane protein
MNPIKKIIRRNRLHLLLVIAVSCLFSVSLFFFRMHFAHSISYIFLLWNLFLAAIPLAISTWMYISDCRKMPYAVFIVLTGTWLLFFPNAPYILTDMLHLRERYPVPIWYDVLLMISFAWNGFIMGLLSLLDIQNIVSEKINSTVGWLFAGFSICLGSFGIYLGRFERWNSWDIITNPLGLMHDILNHIFHPFAHKQTVAVTLLFSVFIGITYFMLRLLTKDKSLFLKQ